MILEMAATFISMKISYHRVLLELDYMSHYDALTGVHNRNALLKRVSVLEQSEGPVGIVYADLNGLKMINDTFGHEAGDKALCETAHILCGYFGRSNVYRQGGDEFVVLLPMIEKLDFQRVADLIRKNKTTASGSVIALGFAYEENIQNIQSSITLADSRMYSDKKDYYVVHDRRKQSN
jgi:diguanylate cyclase (GGDEF)-like protein